MNIDMVGAGPLIIVIVMALVTLATRWGGVYIMSLVPFNNRIRTFIQAMSGSVLVAILTPIAATGDRGAQMALLTTAILMVVFKRPLIAITGGIIISVLVRKYLLFD
uniref:AzlD family protein n=1 Tax=Pantoea sp. IMH TaxID=1267600 RepID=UPI00046905D6|nr:AzlD domain-containing protein [Pantoea sp. IMH]